MEQILAYLPILASMMFTNIMLGMYNNIGVKEMSFDKKVFIVGVIKAVIIAISSILLAYAYDAMDLVAAIGIEPVAILEAAIIMYVAKNIKTLASILGVESVNNKSK